MHNTTIRAALAALFLTTGSLISTANAAVNCTPPPPKPDEHRATVVVALDASGSFIQLLQDPMLSSKAAAAVTQHLQGLPFATTVIFTPFGDQAADSINEQLKGRWVVVNNSACPTSEKVARTVQMLVAGVPTLTKNGKLIAQGKSSILGVIANTASFDPEASGNKIILLSDMIESSREAQIGDTVEAGKTAGRQWLLEKNQLKGVTVVAYGMGLGGSSATSEKALRSTWTKWLTSAGVSPSTIELNHGF